MARGITPDILYENLNIFYECELRQYLDENTNKLRYKIESEGEDYILNVNETEYVKYLTEQYSIVNIEIKFDVMQVSSAEAPIPKRNFPRESLFRDRSGNHLRQVITYHLPFSGDVELLRCRPSSYVVMSYPVTVEKDHICLKIVDFHGDPGTIKREADERVRLIRQQHATVEGEVQSYNSQLETLAANLFHARKQKILRQRDLLVSLGVPIRKRDNLPQTFAIPTPLVKKPLIKKPSVQSGTFSPEPTVDMEAYSEILRIIYDFGKQFERLPATYHEKDEEALRDHILLYLAPRFEGGATGETFNKSGKTDILVRYQNKNAFVAECKFWDGIKQYMKTISQLLSYLTWRDSKAAVILFVRNKDFSSVLKAVEEGTKGHQNYLGFSGTTEESWFNFRFHIPGDESREVKLAVIAFHIPKPE